MKLSWKYADWVIIAIALIVGFSVWFVPNERANKDFKELKRVNAERRAAKADLRARIEKATAEHEALTAKQREEYGIVYVPTPVQPVKPAPAAKPPAKKPE